MNTKKLIQAMVIVNDVGSLEREAISLIPAGIAAVVKQKLQQHLNEI